MKQKHLIDNDIIDCLVKEEEKQNVKRERKKERERERESKVNRITHTVENHS